MTTQEQFKMFVEKQDDGEMYSSAYRRAWQACQDLNNAERESLLAENAMMREALETIANESHHELWQGDLARKSLPAKPRLVEIGEITNAGDDFITITFTDNDCHVGDKLYTIQKGN